MSECVGVGRHRRDKLLMNEIAKRSIPRWIHLFSSIPILGYVNSPFEQLPDYAPTVRYVAVPAIALTGLWVWKRHLVVRRLAGKPN
jgi:hypothetical protein